jgi:hypothetical protein
VVGGITSCDAVLAWAEEGRQEAEQVTGLCQVRASVHHCPVSRVYSLGGRSRPAVRAALLGRSTVSQTQPHAEERS